MGLPEKPLLDHRAEKLWQWASLPATPRQMAVLNLVLGTLLAGIGLLLWLSGAAPPLPDARFVTWVAGALAVAPPFLSLGVYRRRYASALPDAPFSTRAALLVRLLGATSIGLGMTTLYCVWFGLILLAALGFWGLLSSGAQLLLGVAVMPGLLFGYAQATGQADAFINAVHVEQPAFAWDELVVMVAGYLLLLAPWAVLRFWPEFVAPPAGPFLLGIILVALSYALRNKKFHAGLGSSA